MRIAIVNQTGLVTNVIEADPNDIPEWASDFPEVPQGFGKGDSYVSGVWTKAPPPSPTGYDVNKERDRRVLLGKTFQSLSGTQVRLAGDPTTRANLSDMAQLADAQIEAGNGAGTQKWRDEDNVVHDLPYTDIFDLWTQASAYVSACYQAAWTLKDDPNGIPEDYEDDIHWPT